MRRLTILVVVLAGLYGGYWVVGSRAVERGAKAGLAQLAQQGVDVAYADLSTVGFPSRFDTTVTDARLFDPKTGFGWEGPFLQVFALSYQPNKVILIAPPEQTLITPSGDFAIKADGLRASAAVGVSTLAPLTSAILESNVGTITAATGETLAFDKVLLAVRATATPLVYAAFGDVDGIQLPGVPMPIDILRLDALVTVDRALDRQLAQSAAPALVAITLAETRVEFGGGKITATGDLTVDAAGFPKGQIAIIATGWQTMIDNAVAAGLIKPEVSQTYQNMGTMLANGSTDISMPLVFDNGQMALGPFPLGPAPRLR